MKMATTGSPVRGNRQHFDVEISLSLGLTSQGTPLQQAEIENRCFNCLSEMSFKAECVSILLREPSEMFAEVNLSFCFRSSLFHICLFGVFCI